MPKADLQITLASAPSPTHQAGMAQLRLLAYWRNKLGGPAIIMAKKDRNQLKPRSLGDFTRTRRARLLAEFEQDLGVDHLARLKAERQKLRNQRIKTFLVWAFALGLFGIACVQLWHMGQRVEKPFSDIAPMADLIR